MVASSLHIQIRSAGPKDQDSTDRDFDDLLRRAVDFFKSRISPTDQEIQTQEPPQPEERDTDT
jgi:hypothetical protein